jgi:hypothetical protein
LESSGKSQKVVDLWFQLFSDILDDEKLTEKLWNTIKVALGAEGNPEEFIVANLPERKASRVQRRKRRTGREFRLNAHIDDYEIKDVMLDLGSDVNIFPKKTWEAMGKPKLVYSPIQLRMENQYCIFPVGRLQNVEVDLVGVKTIVDFEVIEIMGEKDPYPSLLGIDWAYENYVVIDLKKETMTFESDGMKVTQPLDPYQGPRYTEPVDDNMEPYVLDQLYNMTAGK